LAFYVDPKKKPIKDSWRKLFKKEATRVASWGTGFIRYEVGKREYERMNPTHVEPRA